MSMEDVRAEPEVVRLHARSVELFLDRVAAIPHDRWAARTPCADWDLRALVNHVVGEDRWTVPLLEGRTIGDVGHALDGDLLGASPGQAAQEAGRAAVDAFTVPGAIERTVALSFGETPAAVYAWQLFADHLIHAWDVAAASGGDRTLGDDLVNACAGWFAGVEDDYRSFGAVDERVEVGPEASAQDRLLAAFGREPRWAPG